MTRCLTLRCVLVALVALGGCQALPALPPASARGTPRPTPAPMDRVRVTPDGRSFLLAPAQVPFVPWGLNYDHDADGRLLEDYWQSEWPKVEQDFAEMKALGANVVRVHLQLWGFVRQRPAVVDRRALAQLGRLLDLAERTDLYLIITGLGSYRRSDVPSWYDPLPVAGRWAIQELFWETVAERCAASPAVFAYNLMNEPAVPGERQADYLGPPFLDGRTYVERLTNDPGTQSRWDVGRAWLRQMTRAVRRHDPDRLVTVGSFLVGEQAQNLPIGATPSELAAEVDYLSVHLYPREDRVQSTLSRLSELSVGKPVVVEEMAPLHCTVATLRGFVEASRTDAAGWLGFYWGTTLAEYRQASGLQASLMADWLELFRDVAHELRSRQRQDER